MDGQPSIFPDQLRPALVQEVAAVAGDYSPRYPANSFDRQTAGFVQEALRRLGHTVSIGEAAAFWQSYICSSDWEWPDDAYTVAGAIECIRLYCALVAEREQNKHVAALSVAQ